MMVPPQNTMIIRAVRDDDGPALAKLIADCFAEYEGCFYESAEFPELAAPASWYAPKGTRLIIAEQGGQVVGCTAATPLALNTPILEIHKVYLAPQLRGSGAAQRLLNAALSACGGDDRTGLVLWTDTRFTRAHRFYERLGFVRVPVIRYLADVSETWEYRYQRAVPL
jgi:putative acetyltransferase